MLTCKAFGKAKDCSSCRNAPVNQMGKPAGQPITPPVTKDGRCAQYAQVIEWRRK